MREWTIPDADGFVAECDRLLGPVEPSATLLQLSLAGIVSLSDRIAILGKLDNDLRHRLLAISGESRYSKIVAVQSHENRSRMSCKRR